MEKKKHGAPARTGAARAKTNQAAGDQTIFRVAAYRERPYSQLGNAMIRDKELSPEAVGILVFILSYPPDWCFSLAWLCGERKLGRDKARRIIKEHVKRGYCARTRTRKNDGTLGPYEYVFTDEPDAPSAPETPPEDGAPQTEKPSMAATSVNTTDGLPVTGQPALADQLLDSRPYPNIETKKVSPKKHTNNKSTGFPQAEAGTDCDAATLAHRTADLLAETARGLARGRGEGETPKGPMPFDREDEPVRISADDRATIEALGGDVDELFDRAMAQKAKGRRIGNVVRYMVQSAKNDAKTKLGTELGVVTAIASGNDWAKQVAYAAALAPKPEPPEWQKRVARNNDRSRLARIGRGVQ